MAEMKFKFTIQPYQTGAVDSVVGVFAGQPFNDPPTAAMLKSGEM